MLAGKEIFKLSGRLGFLKRLHNHKLDFHFIRQHGFYVNRHTLPLKKKIARLCKPCQIRSKLHKNAVCFNAAHGARHRFSRVKIRRIFLPSAEQFFKRKGQLFRLSFSEHGAYAFALIKPLARVIYARNGKHVDRNKGVYAGADIYKSAEFFKVGNARVYNIALAQIINKAFLQPSCTALRERIAVILPVSSR